MQLDCGTYLPVEGERVVVVRRSYSRQCSASSSIKTVVLGSYLVHCLLICDTSPLCIFFEGGDRKAIIISTIVIVVCIVAHSAPQRRTAANNRERYSAQPTAGANS
jgi:hypothetical protein